MAIFVHGFAKNERDNIGDDELKELKKLAHSFLVYEAHAFEQMVETRKWEEVTSDEKKIS